MRETVVPRRFFSAFMALVMTVALVAIPLPVSAAVKPAAEAGWGTVEGSVEDNYGAPITGDYNADYVIMVEVWQWDSIGDSWMHIYADEWGNDFQVDYTTGTYAFDLPEGTYKLRFYDWFNKWGASGYREAFYPNSYTIAGAGDVVVTDQGTTTVNMKLALWEHGSVAGVVRDATDGSKIPDISITAYNRDAFGDWNWDGMWSAWSQCLGDYRVNQVPVGQYKLEFSDYDLYRYKTQWYGGGDDIDSAAWTTVAPNSIMSSVNASMVRLGHIKGRVTAASGGAPIKGVSTIVLSWDAVESVWDEVSEGSHQKVTDANGNYDYLGLPPGTYRIVAYDTDGRYLTKAWGSGVSGPGGTVYDAVQDGTDIVVGVGATVTGRDFVLGASARIVGSVRDSVTLAKIPWTEVSLFDAGGGFMGSTQTDMDGNYVLGNVTTGSYKVRFDYAGSGDNPGYYPETDSGFYYDRQYYSAKNSLATANAIPLTAGSTYATPIDASLVPTALWGTVDALITGPNGSALTHIPVAIDYWDVGTGDWWEKDSAITDGSGRVSFKYVPAGKMVQLRANDPNSWDGANLGWGWATATNGGVTGGVTWTANLSLAKAAVNWNGDPLGLIYGKASDAVTSGNIAGVPVTTYKYDSFADEWSWDNQVVADSAGWFEMPAVSGQYVVQAGPTVQYASEFYNNVSTVASATPVTVAAPATTSLVSMPLDKAHTISGTIKDADGVGLKGAYVAAMKWDPDWEVWMPVSDGYNDATSAFTGADGSYSLGGLPNGTYRLLAYSWDGDQLGTKGWKAVGQAQSVDQADDIVFSGAASNHPNYNMTLTPAVTLRGTITDGDSKRVEGVHVKLWWDDPAGTWALINSTYAYNDGDFAFGGFSAGNYFLEFIDDTNYLYKTNWYKNVETSASANPIALADRDSKIITQTVTAVDTSYSPVFGPTRIETAIKASTAAFPDGAKTVVIATGFNWPDALGGAALAGSYKGPILLTNKTFLPWQVADEIERLGASDAIILGSSDAVGNPVEAALKSSLGAAHVTRLQGGNRYETAVKVAEATIDRLGGAYTGKAFISTGENFPDALGASPLAAASSWPIYLTAADTLTTATKTSMTTHGVKDAIILGSVAAVEPAVETSLDTLLGGSVHTTRLGGSNRYETAVIVAQYGVDNVYGLGWNKVAFATGENYPDALAGGVLQGQAGSVLLLTPTNSLHPSVAAKLTAKKGTITEVRYLGSDKAVSNAVRTSIQQILY